MEEHKKQMMKTEMFNEALNTVKICSQCPNFRNVVSGVIRVNYNLGIRTVLIMNRLKASKSTSIVNGCR